MHDLVLGYGVAIAGMIAEVAAMAFMTSRTVNHVGANKALSKMFQAGNLSYALKLCRAGGKSTYLKSVEAAIVAGTSAGTTDRAVLKTAVTTAFDADAGPRGATYQRVMILGLVATIVTLAGCGIVIAIAGLGHHTPAGAAIPIAFCSVFIGIGFARNIGKFGAAVSDARHHLLPALVEALATGSATR